MANTLADSFLADLDDLDDDVAAAEDGGDEAGGAADDAMELCAPEGATVDSVAPLVNSERFKSVVEARRRHLASLFSFLSPPASQKVAAALASPDVSRARVGPLEDDPEYQARSERVSARLRFLTLARSSSSTATR